LGLLILSSPSGLSGPSVRLRLCRPSDRLRRSIQSRPWIPWDLSSPCRPLDLLIPLRRSIRCHLSGRLRRLRPAHLLDLSIQSSPWGPSIQFRLWVLSSPLRLSRRSSLLVPSPSMQRRSVPSIQSDLSIQFRRSAPLRRLVRCCRSGLSILLRRFLRSVLLIPSVPSVPSILSSPSVRLIRYHPSGRLRRSIPLNLSSQSRPCRRSGLLGLCCPSSPCCPLAPSRRLRQSGPWILSDLERLSSPLVQSRLARP
jgi:hypothetical protein